MIRKKVKIDPLQSASKNPQWFARRQKWIRYDQQAKLQCKATLAKENTMSSAIPRGPPRRSHTEVREGRWPTRSSLTLLKWYLATCTLVVLLYFLTHNSTSNIMNTQINRCNIPVIVMGETGCGKTRLIRYMCGLQAGPQKKGQPRTRSMLLVKVRWLLARSVL